MIGCPGRSGSETKACSRHDAGTIEQITGFEIAPRRTTIVVGKSESPTGGHFVTLDIVPIAMR